MRTKQPVLCQLFVSYATNLCRLSKGGFVLSHVATESHLRNSQVIFIPVSIRFQSSITAVHDLGWLKVRRVRSQKVSFTPVQRQRTDRPVEAGWITVLLKDQVQLSVAEKMCVRKLARKEKALEAGQSTCPAALIVSYAQMSLPYLSSTCNEEEELSCEHDTLYAQKDDISTGSILDHTCLRLPKW